MTNTKRLVPELRFPEFSREWKKRKLKDIAKFQNGKAHEKLVSISGDFVLVNSKFISTNTQVKKFVSQQLTPLNKEDIAIVMSDIPNGKALAKCFLVNENNKYTLNQRIGRIYDISGDSRFLYAILNRNTQLLKYDNGVGQTNLKKSEITHIVLKCPINAEQKKIGDFFSKLDRQIELEEEKLELLEQQKRGYMQKIFSQELRFKDDNGNSYPDWSIKKIEDISKVNKGFTPNTKNDEYWDELNENWLSIAGMTQKYLYKGNKGITEKGASKHVKVDKDTLIMSFKLTLGKLAIVKEPIYTNEAICHFVWKESNINTEYMYYYLNSINISTFGAQAVKGVTLNNDSINSIIVKLPVIQEQNKIAYFFNELDKLIRKQYAKIEVLKQRKKGLLQKMFI